LKFDKLGNDSAYGTLIEYLAAKVSRIEVEDEFVTQLREEENSFDFLKIKSQSRADMYCKFYIKTAYRII
jgi:RNA binding exosome subunit